MLRDHNQWFDKGPGVTIHFIKGCIHNRRFWDFFSFLFVSSNVPVGTCNVVYLLLEPSMKVTSAIFSYTNPL